MFFIFTSFPTKIVNFIAAQLPFFITNLSSMENTLLVIFDDLESPNPTLVSRGLDCLDQLLADICLPSHTQHLESTISSVRHSKSSTVGHKKGYKRIALLVDDPAYIELLTLQDSFQYNIATRLMACIKRLANATDESK